MFNGKCVLCKWLFICSQYNLNNDIEKDNCPTESTLSCLFWLLLSCFFIVVLAPIKVGLIFPTHWEIANNTDKWYTCHIWSITTVLQSNWSPFFPLYTHPRASVHYGELTQPRREREWKDKRGNLWGRAALIRCSYKIEIYLDISKHWNTPTGVSNTTATQWAMLCICES